MKYRVYVSSNVVCSYDVEADSPEQAEAKYWDGEDFLDEQHERNDYILDADEEILEIKKI